MNEFISKVNSYSEWDLLSLGTLIYRGKTSDVDYAGPTRELLIIQYKNDNYAFIAPAGTNPSDRSYRLDESITFSFEWDGMLREVDGSIAIRATLRTKLIGPKPVAEFDRLSYGGVKFFLEPCATPSYV